MDNEIKTRMTHFAWVSRGSIINDTALLEMHMNQIISEYFCDNNEKQMELINVILGTEKIGFNSKKETLRYIIEKKYPEFKNKKPKWNSDLTEIMEQRNVFAHYVLDIRESAYIEFENSNIIGFAKYKNQQTIIQYDKEKMLKLVSMINDYVEEFRLLLGLRNLHEEPDNKHNDV